MRWTNYTQLWKEWETITYPGTNHYVDSFWRVMKVFWIGSGIVLALNSLQPGDYHANHF